MLFDVVEISNNGSRACIWTYRIFIGQRPRVIDASRCSRITLDQSLRNTSGNVGVQDKAYKREKPFYCSLINRAEARASRSAESIYHRPIIDRRLIPLRPRVFVAHRGSDNGLYQTPPVPRGTMEGSFVSEDLSLTLPTGYGGGRESDQLSVSSSSSVGGPSPRDRRCLPNDSSAAGIYLPMAPLSSSLHSPASNSKVSVRESRLI